MASGAGERKVTILNKRGLHARAAAKFVKLVEQHGADVRVLKDDMDVCGASIMGLLMLAAGTHSSITILVKSPGRAASAETVLAELVALVERRFDEEG